MVQWTSKGRGPRPRSTGPTLASGRITTSWYRYASLASVVPYATLPSTYPHLPVTPKNGPGGQAGPLLGKLQVATITSPHVGHTTDGSGNLEASSSTASTNLSM